MATEVTPSYLLYRPVYRYIVEYHQELHNASGFVN
ncbi:unknown [Prevotella sp. CAG:1092]|nr:unknown [Prevotella sp. CAG:1092]